MKQKIEIDIDAQVLVGALRLAKAQGRSLDDLVEEALRRLNEIGQELHLPSPLKLITADGHGLNPGIDLDSSASLLDLTND